MHDNGYFRNVLARHDIKLAGTRTVRKMSLEELPPQEANDSKPPTKPTADLRSTLNKLQQTLQKIDDLIPA